MKRITIISGLILALITPALKAQSRTDSIINSIFPVAWNFDFTCYPLRIADTPSVNSEWADELLDFDPYDSISNFGDTSFSILSDSLPPSYYFLRLTFALDTFVHRISITYIQYDEYGYTMGEFDTSDIPYTNVGPKIQAAFYCDHANWNGVGGHSCQCYRGWITIGGASPPLDVVTQPFREVAFSIRFVPNDLIRFSYPSQVEFSRIQIFDLLGRMRDEIPIAPQTTSIEYASNRLAPGMYIATLNGNAIKFIVP